MCEGRGALLRVPSTVGQSVCLCWARSKPKGPKGPRGKVDLKDLKVLIAFTADASEKDNGQANPPWSCLPGNSRVLSFAYSGVVQFVLNESSMNYSVDASLD